MLLIFSLLLMVLPAASAEAAYRFASFRARLPIHTFGAVSRAPIGYTPDQIKAAYGLPATGGRGTIAIVGAYDNRTIEKDLAVFDRQFGLPPCTRRNGCLEKKLLGAPRTDSGWSMETTMDVEWAHAIAPDAKILLVSAASPSGPNLLSAIDYAANRPDVVSASLSWGGPESIDEQSLDEHFASDRVTFFAASGDSGTGVNWPAVSPYVVGVGGTSLVLADSGSLLERAWEGSGGGVSSYESEPDFQETYGVPRANGRRAVPDVAYNADPATGFAVYKSGRGGGWRQVGGTSAGAPQWAAIKALSLSADNGKFYADKASGRRGQFFREITSGNNGDCGYYCRARRRYSYVTGLGTPLTSAF